MNQKVALFKVHALDCPQCMATISRCKDEKGNPRDYTEGLCSQGRRLDQDAVNSRCNEKN